MQQMAVPNPDWLIVDTSHSGAWRLLHAVSNAGGSRFTGGGAVRYPPGEVMRLAPI